MGFLDFSLYNRLILNQGQLVFLSFVVLHGLLIILENMKLGCFFKVFRKDKGVLQDKRINLQNCHSFVLIPRVI